MHEEKNSERKTKESVKEGAVPTYLMEREGVSRAKVICLTEKPHHSSKNILPMFPAKFSKALTKAAKRTSPKFTKRLTKAPYFTKVHKMPHQSSSQKLKSSSIFPKVSRQSFQKSVTKSA